MASLNDTDLTVNYAYDDSGIRIRKTVNGTETKFYLNGTAILTQMTGNEQMDFLYDEAGNLPEFKYDVNSYYYIRNLQSDVTGILSSAGEQIVSYAYDAWGEAALCNGKRSGRDRGEESFPVSGVLLRHRDGIVIFEQQILQSRY